MLAAPLRDDRGGGGGGRGEYMGKMTEGGQGEESLENRKRGRRKGDRSLG